jgi:hypothetical protein
MMSAKGDTMMYRPSEKAVVMSAPSRDLGPEFNAASWKEEIERSKRILRNPRVVGTQRATAEARLRDAREGLARILAGGSNVPGTVPSN